MSYPVPPHLTVAIEALVRNPPCDVPFLGVFVCQHGCAVLVHAATYCGARQVAQACAQEHGTGELFWLRAANQWDEGVRERMQ